MKTTAITAIITAAGFSRRMNGNNKLLANLCGKPVIFWTIKAFQKNKNISKIILTANSKSLKKYQELIKKYKFNKVKDIVKGGSDRFISVYNALKKVDTDYALIHDGARPLVTDEIINAVISGLKNNDAVICAVKAKDTIKYIKENFIINKTIDRDKIYMAQTPQGFKTSLILAANNNIKNKKLKITDDSFIVEQFNKSVKVVAGSYENIKITTPADLVIAQAVLREILCLK